MGQFYLAAISRGELQKKKRRPFHLIVDEFQNYANDAFFQLHEEARKYAIDTVIAHQNLSQISEAMQDRALGAGNKIVLRVTGKDADRLSGEFDATPPPAKTSAVKPIQMLSAVPYTDLKRHSGMSTDVMRWVRDIEKFIERNAYRDKEEPTKRSTWFLELMEDILNRYLRDVMEAEDDCWGIWELLSLKGIASYFKVDFEKTNVKVNFLSRLPVRFITVYGYSREGFEYDYKPSQEDLIERVEFLFWDGENKNNPFQSDWGCHNVVQGCDDTLEFYEPDCILSVGVRDRDCATASEMKREHDYFFEQITQGNYANRHRLILQYLDKVDGLFSYPADHSRRYEKIRANYATIKKSQATEQFILESWQEQNRSKAEANERLVVGPISMLARELRAHPIYQPSAYYEAVQETVRTYADVQNEISNSLRKQKKYDAWIVCADGSEFRDIHLETPPATNPHWKRNIQTINSRSRDEFGRRRQEVEVHIQARRKAILSSQDIPPER